MEALFYIAISQLLGQLAAKFFDSNEGKTMLLHIMRQRTIFKIDFYADLKDSPAVVFFVAEKSFENGK